MMNRRARLGNTGCLVGKLTGRSADQLLGYQNIFDHPAAVHSERVAVVDAGAAGVAVASIGIAAIVGDDLALGTMSNYYWSCHLLWRWQSSHCYSLWVFFYCLTRTWLMTINPSSSLTL